MELVDTDVLIDVQRGFRAAEEWFATDRDIAVPGFVVWSWCRMPATPTKCGRLLLSSTASTLSGHPRRNKVREGERKCQPTQISP